MKRQQVSVSHNQATTDSADLLKQLANLRDSGILTE
jgi:hypothetical protein